MDEQKKDDLTNQEIEVGELDDKDLEDASGGILEKTSSNNNCNCTNVPC
jgi:hypothetical protein